MFVILETGSKQYRVSEGNTIKVEKLEVKEGDTVVIDNVLFFQNDNGEIFVGKPNLENIKVEAKVLKNYKDDKIISFKKRKRKNSKRTRGHRQLKTELEISKIKIS
jgi:large subunit ribosomal protein L21